MLLLCFSWSSLKCFILDGVNAVFRTAAIIPVIKIAEKSELVLEFIVHFMYHRALKSVTLIRSLPPHWSD
ncbi:MAG: hypothetical protein COW76_03725 [Shewanella sp. CG18_big_fil_WC_8_21_14_2_50_42_11]|nr:MAG: hypothetical protein COW76_03725 [Shewanella sp. CG18_big_fil_WC_8_21_14_2_50_42_11]PIX73392.1 MAG: hypothetical protein COZ42_01400 [Shewanella sp. CG_4_10_14_3_um_filter_42_91]